MTVTAISVAAQQQDSAQGEEEGRNYFSAIAVVGDLRGKRGANVVYFLDNPHICYTNLIQFINPNSNHRKLISTLIFPPFKNTRMSSLSLNNFKVHGLEKKRICYPRIFCKF